MVHRIIKSIRAILKNGVFWSLVMFVGVAYIMAFGVDEISSSVSDQQLEIIENNVRRSAVQCYSLEGAYPQDLEYLVEHYGLQYDAKAYVIHYRSTGGNLLPEIIVLSLT